MPLKILIGDPPPAPTKTPFLRIIKIAKNSSNINIYLREKAFPNEICTLYILIKSIKAAWVKKVVGHILVEKT